MSVELFDPHPLFFIEYKRYDTGYSMPDYHYHQAYELYILEEGYHDMLINDRLYTVGMHDVALFRPNLFHRSRRSQPCARTCVYFTERFLHMHFTERPIRILLGCFEEEVITLPDGVFPKVKKLLRQMAREDVELQDNRIFLYLAELLAILSDHKGKPRAERLSAAYPDIAPILAYMNQNFHQIQHIDDIADHFYISKFHLCRKFKEATGVTLIQYLNTIRLQHACQMLTSTSMSILEISAACGYNSSMYFCKLFKQAMNVTPGEYRRNARNS